MKALKLIYELIAENHLKWWLFIVSFVVIYYAVLMLSLIFTFADAPNYVTFYNWPANALEIFRATPSLTDALNILSEEWLVEIGYMNHEYGFGISEWSLTILPFKLLLVIFLAALIITQWRLWRYIRRQPCALNVNAGQMSNEITTGKPERPDNQPVFKKSARSGLALTSGAGMVLLGMANMTMFWVVCCASPSWVVGLAMLGLVSVPTALMLDPLEGYVTLSGLLLSLISLAWLAWAAANAAKPSAVKSAKAPSDASRQPHATGITGRNILNAR